MKYSLVCIGMIFLVLLIFNNCTRQDDFTVLKGPYLGQKPPGLIPEIFAPGVISTGNSEFKAVFSPDGSEIYYQLWGAPFPVILTMKEENDRWTKPKVAAFSGQIIEGFSISPDGKKMFISSQRPLDGKGEPGDVYVWKSEKNEKEWGEIKPLKSSIYGYPAVANNDILYLATGDIWVAKYLNGSYTEMTKLGDSVNMDEFYEEDLFIAPDESYLMFCRRDDGFGSWDIFISFKTNNGKWVKAKNMGDKINTPYSEVYPFVSSDGKYLFFGSMRPIHKNYSEAPLTYEDKINILNSPGNGNADIFWVDAKIIEELKPNNL